MEVARLGRDDPAAVDLEPLDADMRQVLRADERSCMAHLFEHQPERVDGGVGHRIGGDHRLGERRFAGAGLVRRELFAGDPGGRTGRGKARRKRRVVALDGDEQPAAIVDALRRHALQDLALAAALGGGLRVGRGVTPTRV